MLHTQIWLANLGIWLRDPTPFDPEKEYAIVVTKSRNVHDFGYHIKSFCLKGMK